MNASRDDAQPGEWDKILIMGKQIAPDDALFAGRSARQPRAWTWNSTAAPVRSTWTSARTMGAMTDVDFRAWLALATGDGGLDFE